MTGRHRRSSMAPWAPGRVGWRPPQGRPEPVLQWRLHGSIAACRPGHVPRRLDPAVGTRNRPATSQAVAVRLAARTLVDRNPSLRHRNAGAPPGDGPSTGDPGGRFADATLTAPIRRDGGAGRAEPPACRRRRRSRLAWPRGAAWRRRPGARSSRDFPGRRNGMPARGHWPDDPARQVLPGRARLRDQVVPVAGFQSASLISMT